MSNRPLLDPRPAEILLPLLSRADGLVWLLRSGLCWGKSGGVWTRSRRPPLTVLQVASSSPPPPLPAPPPPPTSVLLAAEVSASSSSEAGTRFAGPPTGSWSRPTGADLFLFVYMRVALPWLQACVCELVRDRAAAPLLDGARVVLRPSL